MRAPRRTAVLCSTLLCAAAVLQAQYPPNTRWRQLDTPHYDVIFPQEIAAYAQSVANRLESLSKPLAQTLDATPKRTVVILANQNVTRYVSGFVTLFPRQAVFNTMPGQNRLGTNDWTDSLAATNGSVLVQVEKMNQGFGKLAKALFGESGRMAVIQLTLPDWWIAGEARKAEADLTSGGAGQYGTSEAATRAELLSGRHYSYMKAIHGSFKDQVPSQAELGSLMINHLERTSGAEAWSKILSKTARNSWNPLAMSLAMKKETGRSDASNYSETLSELGEKWKSEPPPAGVLSSEPQIANREYRRAFTSYFRPVFQPDGSVLAQKSGLDVYPVELVRIRPDGSETRLFRVAPAVNGSNRTSVVNGKMVVDEYVPDRRWLRGYTEIVIRDLETGRSRRLTHRTRFMSPVLSPDAAQIAVVEFLPDRTCSLVIISAQDGRELRRLPSPDNQMIYTPAWSEDGRRIVMMTQGSQGRSLVEATLETGVFQTVLGPGPEDAANPVLYRNYVLYQSSFDGMANIYAADLDGGGRYRVTTSKFGAGDPAVSPDGSKLVYSDYTVDGSNVVELPLNPAEWSPVQGPPRSAMGQLSGTRALLRTDDAVGRPPVTVYPDQRYNPSAHLFSFHSWGLTSGAPDLGIGMISNDRMGLMNFHASLIYNTNENAFGFRTGGSYNRFYPVLDYSFSLQNRNVRFPDHTESWNERSVYAGFHVPLNLSRGYYATGMTFSAGVEPINLRGGGLVPLVYGFGFRRARQSSARDLAPAWSQALRLTYRQTPSYGAFSNNSLSAGGRLSVPGLVRHHALLLEGAYERQTGNYYFSSQVQFMRGYRSVLGPTLERAAATYAFPLFYPDWAIGNLAYLKRVSGGLFYDYGKVGNQLYRSAGVEAAFDFGVLHFAENLRAGVRWSHAFDPHGLPVQPFLGYSW